MKLVLYSEPRIFPKWPRVSPSFERTMIEATLRAMRDRREAS